MTDGALRLGILGAARIAVGSIIPAATRTDAVEVAAVATRGGEKARAVREAAPEAELFEDYASLLESTEVDAVYVPLPNSMHVEWTLKALEADKHVLCEKPFSLHAEGAERAVKAARSAGLALMEGFMYRLHPQTVRLAQLLRECVVGEVRQAVAEFGHRLDDPEDVRGVGTLGGGSLGDVVCDTYNSALRRYDSRSDQLVTLAHEDLSEPSGAAVLGGDLLVVDTNDHRIVRVGPDGEVRPFEIRGLLPPAPVPVQGPVAVEIGPAELAGEVELSATLPIPEGQKLDSSLGPPVQLSVSSDELFPNSGLLLTGDELPARTRLALGGAEEGSLDVLLRVGSCEEGPGAVCNLNERRWRVAVRRDKEGSPRLNLGLGG
jgi:hypothetical protein